MPQYGSVDQVIARTAATPETLGFEDAADPDQELRDFVTTNLKEASSAIERYCNRTFGLVQGEEETRHGNNSATIQLDNYPVVSLQTVEEDGNTLTEGEDYRLKGRGNFADENSGILKRLDDGDASRTYRWDDYHRYRFVYDWGYAAGEWPPVLDSVANELVINRLNEAAAERAAGGLESVSMDGYSVSYAVVDAAQKGDIADSQLNRLRSLREAKIA